ncbi:solute carrier family 50 [Fistulifera solaris]|uniref:Sugar transporter SWEET1 n=1 Tax=Fistulifera solaris TaxID=1519565 RepID=A0A1Z5KDW6_FISSO|nr:solute carrier family 50 [Fistulifera solaris]|eukprot:GAX24407.1 solute carrier family 50 [Fistulifera solaris]
MIVSMSSATVHAPMIMSALANPVSLCAQIAPMASIFVIASPFPTVQKIIRDRTVGQMPLLPYSSMLASCFLWSVYGFLKAEPSVWGPNLFGVFASLYYSMQFAKYSPKSAPSLPGSLKRHAQVVSTIVCATLALAFSGLKKSTEIIGYACVVLCLALFGSPLATAASVIRTKSAKSIALPFTIASCVNCFAWTVTGLFKMNDPNVWVTNALGLTFALLQVALKLVYGDTRGSADSIPL